MIRFSLGERRRPVSSEMAALALWTGMVCTACIDFTIHPWDGGTSDTSTVSPGNTSDFDSDRGSETIESSSDTDTDTDTDTDADTDTDTDVDTDVDTDTDTDSDTDTDTDSDSDTETSPVCSAIDPPSDMEESLSLFWNEMIGGFAGMDGARPESASVLRLSNLIWDQLFATEGHLQYCIRWESGSTISATERDQIETVLERWTNNWFESLVGYNCWPYDRISVEIVGVAVTRRDLASWTDDGVPVYVGDEYEGAPQCPQSCGRFFHQDGDYSDCPGGEDAHYDMSLWLTDGFAYYQGADWGQRLNTETFLSDMAADRSAKWSNTFGYGLGFSNFSRWSVWCPEVSTPISVMDTAGTASQITDWDGYMLRYTWDRIQDRLL